MDQKYLLKSFAEGQTPPWRCPSCTDGKLKVVGDFVYHNDADTEQYSHEDWFETENAHYVFQGVLNCDSCGEKVVTVGDGVWETEYGDRDIEYYRALTPRFFLPPLKIIDPKVNDDVPAEVFSTLGKAFQLFWCDPDACVNRLRTVVENLLDGLGVTKEGPTGARLVLARRIEMLTDPKFAPIKAALTVSVFPPPS